MRSSPTIPTASMADVAFLLLLFFLVATAIRDDSGLPVTLPALGTGATGVPELLSVHVNARGEILVDGDVVAPDAARASVARWASRSPVPRVALEAHRLTPYDDYIAALDAVLLGHRDADVVPRLTLREPVR